MDKKDEELVKALQDMRKELKEIKGLMGMILNMMMEMEELEDEDFDPRLKHGGNSDFNIYN